MGTIASLEEISHFFRIETPIEMSTDESSSMPVSSGMDLETQNRSIKANYLSVLGVFYVTGVLVFLLRLVVGYLQVFKLISASQRQPLFHMILAISASQVAPFSFFKWLVVGREQAGLADMEKIIQHELVHFRQKHSLDLLLAELVVVFQWFNPFAWLIRRAIVKNNEFLVDHQLLNNEMDRVSYQYALLNSSLQRSPMTFVNGFNRGLIKKRIEMMNKKETPWFHTIKNVLVLPFATGLVLVFAAFSTQVLDSNPVGDLQKSIEEQPIVQDQDPVKKDTTKYKIRIYKDGKMISIKEIDGYLDKNGHVKVIKLSELDDLGEDFSKDKLIDKLVDLDMDNENTVLMIRKAKSEGEELDVYIGAITKNEDDEVIMIGDLDNDVVVYAGGSDTKAINIIKGGDKHARVIIQDDDSLEDPLYVLDGKILKRDEFELSELDILTVTILKGEDAVEKYGDQAKGGAIIFKTKEK